LMTVMTGLRYLRFLSLLLLCLISMGATVSAQAVQAMSPADSGLAIQYVPDLARYPRVVRPPIALLQEMANKTGFPNLPPLVRGIEALSVPPDQLARPYADLMREGDEARQRGDLERAESLYHAALLSADRRDERLRVGLACDALAEMERLRKRPVQELIYLLCRIDVVDHRVFEREMSPYCERVGELLLQLGESEAAQLAFARGRSVSEWNTGVYVERLLKKYPAPDTPVSREEAATYVNLSTGEATRSLNITALADLEPVKRFLLSTLVWSEEHKPSESSAYLTLAAIENQRGRWHGELYYLLKAVQIQETNYGLPSDTLLAIGCACLKLGEREAGRAALNQAFAYRVWRNERQIVMTYLSYLIRSFRDDMGDIVSALALCETMRQVSQGQSRWFSVGPPYAGDEDAARSFSQTEYDIRFEIAAYLEAAKTYRLAGQRHQGLQALIAADNAYRKQQFDKPAVFLRELTRRTPLQPSIVLHMWLAEEWDLSGVPEQALQHCVGLETLLRAVSRTYGAETVTPGKTSDYPLRWNTRVEIYSTIGFVHARNHRWRESYQTLLQAQKLIREIGQTVPLTNATDRFFIRSVLDPYPYSGRFVRLVPEMYIALGIAARESGHLDASLRHLDTARAPSLKSGDPEMAATLWLELSETYRQKRDIRAAVHALESALPFVDSILSPVGRLRFRDRTASQFTRLKLYDRAIRDYQEAVHLLDSLQNKLRDPEQREMLQETDLGRLYGRYATALYHRGNTLPAQLLEVVERGRIRSFQKESRVSDQLLWANISPTERQTWQATQQEAIRLGRQLRGLQGTAEAEGIRRKLREAEERLRLLQIRLRSRVANPREGNRTTFRQTSLRDLVARNPDTLFLQWVVNESDMLVFSVSGSGGVRCALLPIGRARLTRLVEQWRGAIVSPTLEDIVRERQLAAQVFDTIYPAVWKEGLLQRGRVKRVVLVLDGPLHDVPFAALALDRQGKRRLVDSVALSCRLILTATGNTARSAPPRRQGSLFCVVDPQGEPSAIRPVNPSKALTVASVLRKDLSPLRFAQQEAEQVGRLFPDNRTLRGTAARESQIKAELGNYRFLHFATHGVADDRDGLRSWLLLAEEPDTSLADGRLEADEIAALSLSAELTVLSVCRSGLGRTGTSTGILGFVWALWQAGCPAVVSTLWDIDDAATCRQMVTFYKQLKIGKPKDIALQAAMLAEKGNGTTPPRQWAFLRITGDAHPISDKH
jgi:CHAT domain-containing protein